MTEFPSWAAAAIEALAYVFFGPPLVLYAVFCAGFMIIAIAYPILGAIRGHGTNGPLGPITRIFIGLVGLGVLWQMIAPWL